MQKSDNILSVRDGASMKFLRPSLIGRKAKLLDVLLLAGVGAMLSSAGAVLAADNDEIKPASPAIGADVPVTYFGPAPSSVQRELVGPFQNLKSGKIDFDKGTITLPLYDGVTKSGQIIWYIVTDTDDKGNADQLGLNYSPKLTFADVGRAARKATLDSKFKLVFDAGLVDFSPRAARRRATLRTSFRRSNSSPDLSETTAIARWSRSPTRATTSTMLPPLRGMFLPTGSISSVMEIPITASCTTRLSKSVRATRL
jgi:hypothetical protein